MNELKNNVGKYIRKCNKEIDRIENVIIENSQSIYSQAKMQDRAIILEKVKNDLATILKENEDDVRSIAEKIKQLESEIENLLFDVESQYEPIPGHGQVSVDCVLQHLYKMCDILGFDKANRLPIDRNDTPNEQK